MPDLGRFEAPPAGPRFHDELWEKIAACERQVARRWRLAALTAAACAVAATAAAGVLAFGGGASPTAIDETLACPVPEQGGVNLLRLFARLPGDPPLHRYFWHLPLPATLEVDAGPRTWYLTGDTKQAQQSGKGAVAHVVTDTFAGASPVFKGGYTFDEHTCTKAAAPIRLDPMGLKTRLVIPRPRSGDLAQECWIAPTATVRLRVRLTSAGKPASAQLALVSGPKHKPVAYVAWTPRAIHAWLGPQCHDYSGM